VSNRVEDAVAGLGQGEGPIDERPLSDEERKLVARLLSDPFAFPQTFKTWLVAYLESSDLTLPISSIQGLGSTLGIGGSGNTSFIQGLLPAGSIIGWGSGRTPSGCLRCDGSAYSRTAYSRLFGEIGTSWGAGDGVTTFNVPDLRRRMAMGAGSTGYGLGTSEGRSEGNRSPDHFHDWGGSGGFSGRTGGAGGHSHGVTVPGGTVAFNVGSQPSVLQVAGPGTGGSTDGAGHHDHDFSGSVSIGGNTSGGFDKNRPSFLAIHFVITT
jgi:microcystin-dependent protein